MSEPWAVDSPHGDDARQVALSMGIDPASVLDLAASLNPFAPDVAAIAGRHLGSLARYPDDHDRSVATTALADAFGVDPERLLLTNGGSEAIALVAAELGRGWVEEPDFALYRRHLPRLEPEGPRFRSDPHNPTGLLAGSGEVAGVWDEAFYPLAAGRWTRGDAAQGDSVVVGSLTKVFGCPGLRIGYVLAPAPTSDGTAAGRSRVAGPGLIDRLARRQPRWSVNGLALAMLPELLAGADPASWTASIAGARRDLVAVLAAHGLRPRRSDANYVLVDRVPGLRMGLAEHGVVVRHCASFGMPDTVRIAVPGHDGLARLDRALAAAGVANEPALAAAGVANEPALAAAAPRPHALDSKEAVR